MTARTKLLSQVNSIKTFINELKNVSEKGIQKTLEKSYKKAIEGMLLSIKSLEDEIKKLIAENQDIQKNYKLLLSVPGIGHFTAIYLIGCTNNFAGKISGKQLASYAGVVPFEYSSGISVRGRKKVHPMANKELKVCFIYVQCPLYSITQSLNNIIKERKKRVNMAGAL